MSSFSAHLHLSSLTTTSINATLPASLRRPYFPQQPRPDAAGSTSFDGLTRDSAAWGSGLVDAHATLDVNHAASPCRAQQDHQLRAETLPPGARSRPPVSRSLAHAPGRGPRARCACDYIPRGAVAVKSASVRRPSVRPSRRPPSAFRFRVKCPRVRLSAV